MSLGANNDSEQTGDKTPTEKNTVSWSDIVRRNIASPNTNKRGKNDVDSRDLSHSLETITTVT